VSVLGWLYYGRIGKLTTRDHHEGEILILAFLNMHLCHAAQSLISVPTHHLLYG
jgi:hypothetical protein